MKKKLSIVLLFLLLMVTACGANPVEKLEEAAAEQIAETIIEQASGIDDIEIDADGGSISYEDEDGNSTTIDTTVDEEVKAIEGMGFNIPLPDGLVDGYVQQIDQNGEPIMITGSFSIADLTAEEFAESMHTTLTSQGFSYTDTSGSGKDRPDLANEIDMAMLGYEHPEGYVFTALWGEGGAILGLSRTEPSESGTDASSDTATSADNNDSDSAGSEESATETMEVTFDGSINLDKTKYAANEQIKVTLTINTPLADNAWVGIVPSDTPHGLEADSDAVDITYVYVRDAQDGIIMLEAPYDAGNYDVRIFDTDSNGVELDSVSIIVE